MASLVAAAAVDDPLHSAAVLRPDPLLPRPARRAEGLGRVDDDLQLALPTLGALGQLPPEALVGDRMDRLRVRLPVVGHGEAALGESADVLAAGMQGGHGVHAGQAVELPAAAQAAPVADVHDVGALVGGSHLELGLVGAHHRVAARAVAGLGDVPIGRRHER